MSTMTIFEMLLEVARQEYETVEEPAPETKKISRKRHASSDTWTFEEIKALSAKALVDRFAVFAPDELTKKYYYHCRLLPGICTKTEWSFGNEQKAWKLMKMHLKAHLNEQSSELDQRVFAKSPALDDKPNWPLSVPKPTKMPIKSKFISETESSDNDSLVSADCFKSKKMLEFGSESRGSTAKRKQCKPKHKSVQHNGWSFPVFSPLPTFQGLKNAGPPPCESDILHQNEQSFNFTNPWKIDHDYTYKNPFPLSTRCMLEEQETEPKIKEKPVKKRSKVQKQFIIKTPGFPYVHALEEYVVSEIVEIDSGGNHVKYRQRAETNCLDIKNYMMSKMKEEKSRFEAPNSIELLSISETKDVTGSVLECVENKVSKKCAGACAMKISYSSSDNDENSENVKKAKKELALNHIMQLTSKKKKQYQGPLLCQLCDDGRQFTAVASLMHHYRSHAGIKLYVCELCSDTFTRQHSLNYHMMIHNNKSRFECEVCGRNFRHPSHFKEHLRRHTGETPFQCAICGMLFKTRNTYKRHLRMQHNKILTSHGIVDNTEDAAPTSSKRLKKNSQ